MAGGEWQMEGAAAGAHCAAFALTRTHPCTRAPRPRPHAAAVPRSAALRWTGLRCAAGLRSVAKATYRRAARMSGCASTCPTGRPERKQTKTRAGLGTNPTRRGLKTKPRGGDQRRPAAGFRVYGVVLVERGVVCARRRAAAEDLGAVAAAVVPAGPAPYGGDG